jgi:WD40 repeat protein
MDWPMVIDKTTPRKLNFISIDSLGKGVRITWEKFDHPSFKSYRLIRSSSAFMGTSDLVISNDPHQNSFIDTTYMEGMVVNYQIELLGICSNLECSWINSKKYFQIPHEPRIKYIKNFQVEVSWDPPRNKNLLAYYYLHGDQSTVTMDERYKIFDPEIRTQRKNVTFGAEQYFGVLYVPKSVTDEYTANLLRGEAEYTLGEEMPLFNYSSTVRNSQFILLSYKGSLYKYNLSSGISMDSVQFNCEVPDYFSISNNSNFFGYSENGKFITRSTQDFSLISSMTNTEYASNSDQLFMFSVSDTNRLLTIRKDNTLTVFDLETGNKIAEKKFGSLDWTLAKISPDGKHIIAEEYDGSLRIVLYQIIGDQIVEVGRTSEFGLSYTSNLKKPFGPDQDIYIIYSGKIEVRDILDFSIKKVINLKSVQLLDFQNMSAVGSSSDFPGSDLGYLYDLASESVVKNLRLKYPNIMYFYSNYLFTKDGRKLNLENIQ